MSRTHVVAPTRAVPRQVPPARAVIGLLLLCSAVLASPLLPASRPVRAAASPSSDTAAIRVNQLGYRPHDRKVAVLCSTAPRPAAEFVVEDAGGGAILGPLPARDAGAFGPCRSAHRLDFSALRRPGQYRIRTGELVSPAVRIHPDAYAGAADTTLLYMRQQRSGFNPLFRDSVHHRTDAILVDHPSREGEFIPVAGGWADAADYLQYVTTSATATVALLKAARDHPGALGDAYGADGLPGANGVPDALDEARWGLEWLVRMYPEDDLLLNQIGDDRDHAFFDLPPADSSDYGWGKGGYRPVYPCTGRPQGLLGHRNRSDGLASTAGKMAAAFALGAHVLGEDDPAFARVLTRKARAAYALGRSDPGVCQTAPARAPYFYEEGDWVDDMELAAAELHALTGEEEYLTQALEYAATWPVSPWMGADTARHYQWYPWLNHGHHEAWRVAGAEARARLASYYRRGLEAVASRAENGFRMGVPFIWCSNDLVVALATQALLYREMTGDTAFVELEAAARDWLFGTNPWGTSMVVGFPDHGRSPADPHSVVAAEMGAWTQKGALVDGPVYRSIFESLAYVELTEPDEYASWNTGRVVYHDDFGDYSTNEPIMDGTAALTYLLAALAEEGVGIGRR